MDDRRRASPEAWAEDARLRFEALYERQASWDVPFAQPAIVELAARGLIRGTVLDAGCGSGENALHLAGLGFDVWGVDVAPSAVARARESARRRGLPAARFLVGDALSLEVLGMEFGTVVDSGLFHALTDAEREAYVEALARATRPGGLLHILCFSDRQPGDDGPRRISDAELRTAFVRGWTVRSIEPARFRTNIHGPEGAAAWLATVERTARSRESGDSGG